MKTTLDSMLGRVTTYRLVVLCLGFLVVVALAFSVGGAIAFEPSALLATLLTLLVVTYASSRLFALLFRVTPHGESSIITALLLFFILQPTTELTTLLQIGLAGLFASGSKYVLAVRGRHIFNPAAVGAVWLAIFQFYLALWWVGGPVLAPFTAVLALLVLYRTRRLPLGAVFVLVAAAILVTRNLADGATLTDAFKFAFAQTPLIFFAGFMLSEPLTQPPARWQQLCLAGVVAVLFSVPITVGSFLFGPESALIIGNALAFLLGQRRSIELVMTAKRALSPTSMEFVFRPKRAVSFKPGQYLEMSVPHPAMDSRGSRRSFSIASAPADVAEVKIGIKVADRSSSFKRALCATEIGETVRATGIAGDFVLPKDPTAPLLLVAGGIGITPFASQLAALDSDHQRDIMLIYAVSSAQEVSYADVLQQAGIRVVVFTKAAAKSLPAGFEQLVGAALDRSVLLAAVPDISARRVFVSGPPEMVNAVGGVARQLKAKSVTRDYFSGY